MNYFHRGIRTLFTMEITHKEQFDQTQPEERKRIRINSPPPKGKAINTAESYGSHEDHCYQVLFINSPDA